MPAARISKKTTSRVYSKKRAPKSTGSVVKRTILSMSPSYHFTTGAIDTAMLHNTIYTYNVTSKLVQGTSNDNRQGDAVHLMSLHLKGNVFTETAAGAYQYRIMVVKSAEDYNPTTIGSGLGASDLFQPDTTSYITNGIVNNKACSVIADYTVDLNSQIDGFRDIRHLDFRVPLNKKFQYQGDGSVYGKTNNIFVVTMATRFGGATGVTAVGQCGFSADLCFKNL